MPVDEVQEADEVVDGASAVFKDKLHNIVVHQFEGWEGTFRLHDYVVDIKIDVRKIFG